MKYYLLDTTAVILASNFAHILVSTAQAGTRSQHDDRSRGHRTPRVISQSLRIARCRQDEITGGRGLGKQ